MKNLFKDLIILFSFIISFNLSAQSTIVVQSAAVSALYSRCNNEVQVIRCDLGADPTYSATGASVMEGSEKGQVTIIPGEGATSVAFTVSSGGSSKTFDFKVLPVPKPSVYLGDSGGNPLPLEKPIDLPNAIRIVVKPDEGFARLLPKEANFKVLGGTITQYSGGKAIKTLDFSGADINTGDFQAQKGDGFTVSINGVQRVSQSGEVEDIKSMPGGGFVSFTVK